MGKMNASLARARDKWASAYNNATAGTYKGDEWSKGREDSMRRKVIFNQDMDIEHPHHGNGAFRKMQAKNDKKKHREMDDEGFVSIKTGKGSPTKEASMSRSKMESNSNSFTALQQDDDGEDDEEIIYFESNKLSEIIAPMMSAPEDIGVHRRNKVKRLSSFNATTKQNLLARTDISSNKSNMDTDTTKTDGGNISKLLLLTPEKTNDEQTKWSGNGGDDTVDYMNDLDCAVGVIAMDCLHELKCATGDNEKISEAEPADASQDNGDGAGNVSGEQADTPMEDTGESNETPNENKDENNDDSNKGNRGSNNSQDGNNAPENRGRAATSPKSSVGHFGIRIETMVQDQAFDMTPVRELFELLHQAKCSFYNHQEMGGKNRASTIGIDWDHLKEFEDDELIRYLNLTMIQWGSPRTSSNLRLCFSFWVDCPESTNVSELKKNNPGIMIFLKNQDWYLKSHTLHQSQTANVAFIMGKHPNKSFKEGLRDNIFTFINENSKRQGSIYVDVVYAKINVNESKVPVLAIQCGMDDRQTIDNILKSGARHPTIDIVSEKLKSVNRNAFKLAMENHMSVCQCSTAITIAGLNELSEKILLTALLEKKNEKKESLIVDLERHRLYAEEGKYYVICHKDDVEAAVPWISQCLEKTGEIFWLTPGTAPTIISKPTRRTQSSTRNTEWDEYTYSSRTFVSRETDVSGASTWADKVRGMDPMYGIPLVIIPKSSDASSVGDSSKGSLTTSLVTDQDKTEEAQQIPPKPTATPKDNATLESILACMQSQAAQIESLTAQISKMSLERNPQQQATGQQEHTNNATPQSWQHNSTQQTPIMGNGYMGNPSSSQGYGNMGGYHNSHGFYGAPNFLGRNFPHQHSQRDDMHPYNGMVGMPPMHWNNPTQFQQASSFLTPTSYHHNYMHGQNPDHMHGAPLQEPVNPPHTQTMNNSATLTMPPTNVPATTQAVMTANNKKRQTPATPDIASANTGDATATNIASANGQPAARETQIAQPLVQPQDQIRVMEVPVENSTLTPEVVEEGGKRTKLSQTPSKEGMDITPIRNNAVRASEQQGTMLGPRELFPDPGGGKTLTHQGLTESPGEKPS